jgi:hypothetical protein
VEDIKPGHRFVRQRGASAHAAEIASGVVATDFHDPDNFRDPDIGKIKKWSRVDGLLLNAGAASGNLYTNLSC